MSEGAEGKYVLVPRSVPRVAFDDILELINKRCPDQSILVLETNSDNLLTYGNGISVYHYRAARFEPDQVLKYLEEIVGIRNIGETIVPMVNNRALEYNRLIRFVRKMSRRGISCSLLAVGESEFTSETVVRNRLRDAMVRLRQDRSRLKELHNIYRGERCFVMGNGPSLNRLDLQLLAHEITFGANAIHLNRAAMGFMTTFYTIEDQLAAEDNAYVLQDLECEKMFFPLRIYPILGDLENAVYFNYEPAAEHNRFFSRNFASIAYSGYTVVFINLQLAYYMGFRDVYLIGVDLNYKIDTDAQGDMLLASGEEQNHFHPNYHVKNQRLWRPHIDKMIQSLRLAGEAFAEDGRAIYNASPGGNLNLFRRVDFHKLLR